RADPAWRNDKGVRGQNEMVQPRKERLVLERLLDEWVGLLLEGQLDANADRGTALRSFHRGSAFVGGLHKTGTAARDNVAAHVGQSGGDALDLFISERPRLSPRRAEDRHPIAFFFRWLQAREIVDDLPKAKHGADEDFLDRFLVGQADGA